MVRFMKKKSGNIARKKVSLILKDVIEDFIPFDNAFQKAMKNQKSKLRHLKIIVLNLVLTLLI